MQKIAKLSLVLLLSVTFLPSCFNKSEKKTSDNSRVLISVEGKPVLTEKQLEEFVEQAVEANPQAKMMYAAMPELIKEQAFESKRSAATMGEWAKREGIRESEEYKKKLNQIIDAIQANLDQEEFMKKHKGNVTEEDIVAFYEAHKNEPQFQVSQGGIKAIGIEFKSQEEADKFVAELKGNLGNAENVAKAKKLAVKDFGIINKDAFAPKYAKSGTEGIAKFPSSKVVKDGKSFWLVISLSKEAGKTYTLDEVREGLRRMLESQKSQEALVTKVPEYQKKFNIVIDETFVNDLKEQSQKRQEEFKQKMEAQQGAQKAAPQAPKSAPQQNKAA